MTSSHLQDPKHWSDSSSGHDMAFLFSELIHDQVLHASGEFNYDEFIQKTPVMLDMVKIVQEGLATASKIPDQRVSFTLIQEE